MDIVGATRSYERWLARQVTIVKADLDAKHAAMAEGPFPLLRATFYRWMQLWQDRARDLDTAPRVVAVGDLHVENFGTWRDAEGRLIWGINDFDEAHPLPFTIDLVRLATSTHLAIDEAQMQLGTRESCDAILQGYIEGMHEGGRPFVLSERNTWLWRLAVSDLRNPKRFWRKIDQESRPPHVDPPKGLVAFVQKALPRGATDFRIAHRRAGKGSLGRQRFLFRVAWNGGVTAREAKPLLASACEWAAPKRNAKVWSKAIVDRAVHAPDPFALAYGAWAVRRLAPDCSKIDLSNLPSGRDETKLLWAMGFDTANVHLGTRRAREAILAYLASAPARWLDRAAKDMAVAVRNDSKDWRARGAVKRTAT